MVTASLISGIVCLIAGVVGAVVVFDIYAKLLCLMIALFVGVPQLVYAIFMLEIKMSTKQSWQNLTERLASLPSEDKTRTNADGSHGDKGNSST